MCSCKYTQVMGGDTTATLLRIFFPIMLNRKKRIYETRGKIHGSYIRGGTYNIATPKHLPHTIFSYTQPATHHTFKSTRPA